MVLGAIMLNRGLAVSGTGADFHTLVARVSHYLSPEEVSEQSLGLVQNIARMCWVADFRPTSSLCARSYR